MLDLDQVIGGLAALHKQRCVPSRRTFLIAQENGCSWIGIELSRAYIRLVRERLGVAIPWQDAKLAISMARRETTISLWI